MQTNKIDYPFLPLREINSRFEPALSAAVGTVVASGQYIGGNEVMQFEQSLAAMCGVENAVGLSTGLDALRLTLRAMVILGRLAKGDGVIVPANSFIASALAIVDAGLVPVFAEPSTDDFLIHAEEIDRLASENVRAVMPVDLYGKLAVSRELVDVCRRRGLLIIEDAAQAIGAVRTETDGEELHPGQLVDAAAFSFYPAKNVGALGDAGAVVTSDNELATTIRALANYGETKRYHCSLPGFNCRLDPIQAAILNVKLPYTNEENRLRRRNGIIYCNEIDQSGILLTPRMPELGDAVHQFVVRCVGIDREVFRRKLRERGVETAIHYPVALNRQIAMSGYFDVSNPCPIAEMLSGQVVSLPVSSATSAADVTSIAGIINQILQEL